MDDAGDAELVVAFVAPRIRTGAPAVNIQLLRIRIKLIYFVAKTNNLKTITFGTKVTALR
jgi:hypothetical protein